MCFSSSTGWLIPLPAVLVALIKPQSKYIISYFPPEFCITSDKDLWFYSTMLVIDVLAVIHMMSLIVVLWVVHKVRI